LDAAAQLVGADTVVLRAGGSPREADIRFSGLNQRLHPARAAIGELAFEVGRPLTVACGFDGGPRPDGQLVSDAALALLHQMSATRPVLLIVDDLHWLDAPTLATLQSLVSGCNGHTIGMLAAYRAGATFPFDRRRLTEHELQPLDQTAATALLLQWYPKLTSAARRRVLANACGNPLAPWNCRKWTPVGFVAIADPSHGPCAPGGSQAARGCRPGERLILTSPAIPAGACNTPPRRRT
jgi:hypothetical protein